MEKRFPKKRIFVTGAGSGFGKALSLAFAKRGWKIACADIKPDRAEQTAKEVRALGGDPLVVECDVTKFPQVEKAGKTVKDAWGGMDIVVNNAGVAGAGYVKDITSSQWDWILAINLKGVIHGCRVFIPMMEEQGGGHIVNMASSAGIANLPEMSCYNVTKAAVISLTETLKTELSPKNIGVTVLAPTFFKTGLMEEFRCTDERQRKMAESFFARSLVTAEDVAEATIKAIRKNRLYVIPQIDGKFVFMLKRLAPESYFKGLAYLYKRGLMDKFLGI
ncbi:MAG: SDR family oxidoreductase [Deltaproteobacteria bacterium]|nr:SDR family oxidoreductase [Deltaproteobacteria bacterium]